MSLVRLPGASAPARSAFTGFRFPREVIVLSVRWYLRFGLSYRDVEELLAERGIAVDHVTVHRWVQRFAPLLADAARFGRHRVGDRWHVDETYVKVAGRWVYLYRAVDQFAQVIDVYASSRRDREAASRFFQHARKATGVAPVEVITDRAPTYPRVLDQTGAGGLAPHRAARQQPRRGRPRAAETAATPDARDQDHGRTSDTRRWSRLRPEPASRSRRSCHRRQA
jgi:transposase-like protein